MRLDRLIQILIPHDEKFYTFFEESAQNVVNAAMILPGLYRSIGGERERIMNAIHDFEHIGDNVTHKIFGELNSTFVTPFDREDIHLLASVLDDVMDYIDGSASRFVLYKVQRGPESIVELAEILQRQTKELQKGVSLLRDFRKSEELERVLQKINEYENEADAVFEKAIARLFEEERDPIQLIKLKEIYVGLETATDKCEDAANVLETFLVKHA
jgi:predicted phosphate transport protein (TIGR00153 family)